MPSTLEFQHDIPGLDPDFPAEPWITTTEGPRTLVLCFDGTGNELGDHNTNVAQFFKLLKGDDESQQKVYYQALDMAFAWSIGSHIMDGYTFLVDNYNAGDKICLFGFSRGAYTARALAGMLHKVGLLRSGNTHDIDNAYDLYLRTDALASEDSAVFKAFYSINVDIQFIGVWDTVCSVGIPEKHFPFTASCPSVRTFRHALSLDERRVKFKADHHDASGLHKTDVKEVWFAGCHADVGGGSVANEKQHSLARISLRWMVRECVRTNTGIKFCNELLEDIGLDPETLYSRAEADIVHDPDFALPRPLAVHSTEDVEEIKDALCMIYDELALRPLWWIVEVAAMPWQEQLPKSKRNSKKSIRVRPSWFRELPPIKQRKQLPKDKRSGKQSNTRKPTWFVGLASTKQRKQPLKNKRKQFTTLQLARGRTIPIPADTGTVLVHTSVRMRMQCPSLEYKPAAENWDSLTPVWVD